AMAVVEVGADEVPDDLHVAVYSSPVQTVVTGDPGRVAEFAASVAVRGLFARTLTAEGAGHSPQVRPLLPRLREELAGIVGGKPDIPYYSPVFDDSREVPAFEAAYWAAALRRPVRLMQAVRAAAEDGHTLFTELGPRPLLADALRETLPPATLITAGGLYDQVAAAAAAVVPRTSGRITDVPHSPWHHVRHWATPKRPPTGHPLLGAHVETPAGHSWTTTLDDLADAPWRLPPDDWHRDGHPVLPLAAVARLAHAAATEVHGEAELYDVTLRGLLPLPAQVTITLAGTKVELSAKNAAGAWTVYGTAALTPAPDGGAALERIGHVAVNGAFSDAETANLPPGPVPTRLDAKLVTRTWTPTPQPEAGPPRAWLILADEGDTRAARLHHLVGRPGDPANVLVLPPRHLDPAGVRRIMLQVAGLAGRGVRIMIATERAQAVRDGEPADPGPAALRGLIRVLALEHPETHATLVDFDDLTDLATELAGDPADDEVAWRDGTRYAARLRRA
ncbi:acyltransferase domain-containing protein, partial [Nonomuraea basaltis]|uniref:acyltransferase domain-containing protein n=1 Tax=Nonomuraea basaltis TaxID=2495887 RepID=UPI00110C5C50